MKQFLGLFFVTLVLFTTSCSKQGSTVDTTRPTTVSPNGGTGSPNGCISVDTDGDGIKDCQDPDIDNDGKANQLPYVSINFTCYNKTNSLACFNATTTQGKCQWVSETSKCVSEKSCGVITSQNTCQTTTGCSWTNNTCTQQDWFPYNSNEYLDSDFDGYGDVSDAFPNDATEWLDSLCIAKNNDINWCKQLGDNMNPDDDWDGVPDQWDDFSKESLYYFDSDKDGIPNIIDPDSDNDGVPDVFDDLPFDSRGYFDIDHDGIPSASDTDIDGDGIANELDAFPYDSTEWLDTALKGIGNNINPDDDWDGVPDQWDDFSLDKRYYWDSDHDGVANQLDAFPYNASEWKDTDGDGYGDNIDAFPTLATEWRDTDGDGIGDNSDPDADSDGFYNTVPSVDMSIMNLSCFKQQNNATCASATQSATLQCTWASNNRCVPSNSCGVYGNQANCNSVLGCEWQGNVCENQDYFPYDRNDKSDYGKLGLGDNTSQDLDWDGVPNQWDYFPKNNQAFFDFDNDGLIDIQLPTTTTDYLNLSTSNYYGYKIDPDSDNDGVPDFWDDLPYDQGEYYDLDGDRIGNNLDQDLDGDGVSNTIDKFPYDSSDSKDTLCFAKNNNPLWCGQLGDNINPDADWDGVPNQWDALPVNPAGFFDYDNNGVPDQTSLDLDGDGVSNGLATPEYLDPIHPENGVVNPYGITCGKDTNSDGVPDTLFGRSSNDFACAFIGSLDKYSWDASESYDTDNDQLGDNIDPDADNDGVPDQWDDLPLDSRGFFDIDRDGIPDTIDTDIDGDGQFNNLEANTTISPYGIFCGYDANSDNIIDTPRVNDFTCEYLNTFDDFAYDSSEAADTDGDGLGDGIDPDRDNDGVPNFWDDFSYDARYYWDNDKDGIANELDIYTPNGITNQADLMTAISHGENIIINADITIDHCIDLPEGLSVASATDDFRITYTGPDNSCMFRIMQGTTTPDGLNTTFANVIFEIPKKSSNVKLITSSGILDELDISQSVFRLYGKGIIADVTVNNQFLFIRNNLQLTTDYDMPLGYNNLINLKSSSPSINNYLTLSLGGNIIFWNITANQTQQVSFLKTTTPYRKISLSANVFKLNKSSSASITGILSFMNTDFDYNEPAGDANRLGFMSVTDNRVNLNAGQLLYLTSSNNTLTSTRVTSYANKIYGSSTTGNNYTDFDNRELFGVNCDTNTDQNSCSGNNKCTWNSTTQTSGNYCVINSSLSKPAVESYFNFSETDVWLNPRINDFSMFYYPNIAKMGNSPALFDAGSDTTGEINTIQGVDLGLGSVYYVGAYGPVTDTDMDGYRNEIDGYPFDASEWRDSDKDNIGNITDTDDDNDSVLDIDEHSVCQIFEDDKSCADMIVCSWDKTTTSCKRNIDICSSFTTAISCSAGVPGVCAWDLSSGSCNNDLIKGCLVAGSSWSQANKCCTNSSGQCVDGSDPYVTDSDGDGLTDYEELYTYNTNPLLKDTDGDGDNDGDEIANHSNPNDPNSSKDTDGDGLSDKYEIVNLNTKPGCSQAQFKLDTDGDGLTDYEEVMIYHTNPCISDTDGDGITDYEEVMIYHTNPILSDSDGDGLSDYEELRTYHTNPLVTDTDGDGVPDNSEVASGTNPNDPLSYLDTDGDGEPDYTDKTPFGVVPYPSCSSASLANCANAFSIAQYSDEFFMQFSEANSCAGFTTAGTCSTTRSMCTWDGTICKAKDIILTHDIDLNNTGTFNACFTVNINSNLTIRSNSTTIRRKISLGTNLYKAPSCNSELSSNPSVAANALPLFTLGSTSASLTSSLTLNNIRIESTNTMPRLISTKTTGAKGNNITIKNSEFYSYFKNGASLLFALDPSNVSIEKSTFKSLLVNGTTPVAPSSSVDIRNTDSALTTTISIKGSLFYCDTQDNASGMITASIPYACLNTQGDVTNFEGNLVYLDQSVDVLDAQIDSNPSNLVYAWKHQQSTNPIVIKNDRILSQSKSLYIDSIIGTDIINLGIRNGSVNNPGFYDKTVGTFAISASVLPTEFGYGTVFAGGSSSTSISCTYLGGELDSDIQSGLIHPAYYSNSPALSYWNTIYRVDRFIQTMGAYNELSCP